MFAANLHACCSCSNDDRFLLDFQSMMMFDSQHVAMETSGSLVALLNLKGVWRFATMQCGELCVMIYGALLMLTLSVDNWDTLHQVIFMLRLAVQ